MQTPSSQTADPAPLLRAMGAVLTLWGAGFLAYTLFRHSATWAAMIGLAFWATALIATWCRHQVP